MKFRMDEYVKHIQRKYERIENWKRHNPVGEKVPNFFADEVVEVYTDVLNFESPYQFVYVHNYSELGYNYKNWVDKKSSELSNHRTRAEIEFSKIMAESKTCVLEQPYFRINKKGYFLDFYLPQFNLAFELNGSIHKGKEHEEYDFTRDYDFHTIGIKTVRLTNDDIKSPDIKQKINEWATRAFYGNFDAALYYSRTDKRRFDKKKTRFQEFHDKINETLKNKKYEGKRVILKTDWDYFCKTLRCERYDASNMVNQDQINEFYDIIEKNNISFDTYFVGHRENMKPRTQLYIVENNNETTSKKPDFVITILGKQYIEDDYNVFADNRILQFYSYSNKDNHYHHTVCCPYGMYYPFVNENTKKKKPCAGSIIIGDYMCSVCEYCVGLDRKYSFVNCEGYKNKGTKSILDHIAIHKFSSGIALDRMEDMKAYRETKKYSSLVAVLEKRKKGSFFEKYKLTDEELAELEAKKPKAITLIH